MAIPARSKAARLPIIETMRIIGNCLAVEEAGLRLLKRALQHSSFGEQFWSADCTSNQPQYFCSSDEPFKHCRVELDSVAFWQYFENILTFLKPCCGVLQIDELEINKSSDSGAIEQTDGQSHCEVFRGGKVHPWLIADATESAQNIEVWYRSGATVEQLRSFATRVRFPTLRESCVEKTAEDV